MNRGPNLGGLDYDVGITPIRRINHLHSDLVTQRSDEEPISARRSIEVSSMPLNYLTESSSISKTRTSLGPMVGGAPRVP
jgi:hypothetical protein